MITFKSFPKYYEKEKSGIKNNTIRFIEDADTRFSDLKAGKSDLIKIINSENGDFFIRKITDVTFFENICVISFGHEECGDNANNSSENGDYYIISVRHSKKDEGAWTLWRPGSAGYTLNVEEAGLYSKKEIVERGYKKINCKKMCDEILDYIIFGKGSLDENLAIHKNNLSWLGGKQTRLNFWF